LKKDTEVQWRNEWGANIILSHGNSNSCGVAVLLKKGTDCTIHSRIIDPQGSYIILKADIADHKYTLINIYALNKDNDIANFLEKLRKTLLEEHFDADEKVIVGGDFNCTMNPLLDKKGSSLAPRKIAIASIECFQEEFILVDIWRVKNPEIKSFTWCQSSPQIFSRVDYWFISNNLPAWIKSTDIIPALRTDHSAIMLVEEDNGLKHKKGQGYWKMNCTILDDSFYNDEISNLLPKWVGEGRKELSDNRSIWEWTKFNVRDHTIQFLMKRARSRKDKEAQLEKEYASAKQIYENDSCENNLNMLITAWKKIESFYEEKTRGKIIRARWHEYGEKSSKYFLNLEK